MKGIVSLTAFAFHPQIAAVEIKLEPEWHIYWENPGDSGMETYLESDGQLLFPVPKKIQLDGDIVNYGYEEKVTLFVQNPSADQIRLRWLVCKADTCVP
ncbi:MAG: protein-disulfide reductase DsbD domain-containing protein, partial [Myxococcota bacterium]|nr:protein-disulfide reductase DsbD domain-containing protein [Myxococcota bacterium]